MRTLALLALFAGASIAHSANLRARRVGLREGGAGAVVPAGEFVYKFETAASGTLSGDDAIEPLRFAEQGAGTAIVRGAADRVLLDTGVDLMDATKAPIDVTAHQYSDDHTPSHTTKWMVSVADAHSAATYRIDELLSAGMGASVVLMKRADGKKMVAFPCAYESNIVHAEEHEAQVMGTVTALNFDAMAFTVTAANSECGIARLAMAAHLCFRQTREALDLDDVASESEEDEEDEDEDEEDDAEDTELAEANDEVEEEELAAAAEGDAEDDEDDEGDADDADEDFEVEAGEGEESMVSGEPEEAANEGVVDEIVGSDEGSHGEPEPDELDELDSVEPVDADEAMD